MADHKFEDSSEFLKKQGSGNGSDRVAKTASSRASNAPSYSREVAQMLSRIKELKEDLDSRLGVLYETGRAKHLDVHALFENIHNLTVEQIQGISLQERELQEKLKMAIPPESCIRRVEKSKEKLTKERKGKFRGDRQKWIPM